MLKECMYDVRDEQIGQAFKCFEGSQPFYMVVNSKNETDAGGHLIEYKVTARFDTEKQQWVFACKCKSGEHNFKNVKHPSHVCWHVRAALACAKEEKKALKEMAQAIDAEKQFNIEPVAPTEDTRPVATSLVQVALGEPMQYRIPTWDDVKSAESVATEVVAEPVTVTPTERAIVATEVARDLRAKTASRMSGWNNSHMSTLTEREKWTLTAKPAAHMKKSEPVVKGSLYSRPFNFYR